MKEITYVFTKGQGDCSPLHEHMAERYPHIKSKDGVKQICGGCGRTWVNGSEFVIPWVQCDDCDDYICNAHEQHVSDCDCPVIEVWSEHELWPYGPVDKIVLDEFLKNNRYDPDEQG